MKQTTLYRGFAATLLVFLIAIMSFHNQSSYAIDIGNSVWNDLDADGIQDGGESGIDGVVIYLFQDADGDNIAEPGGDDGNRIQTTTTSGGGQYSFTGLSAGSYFIGVSVPSGYAISPINQGGNEGFDSDVSPTTQISAVVAISTGAEDTWGVGLNTADTPVVDLTTQQFLSQSNWDGGVGANTTSQYSSVTNIDAATNGQFELTALSNWYNSAWSTRRTITIQSSQIAADQTNFPVYLSESNFDAAFFSTVKSNGADIIFTASDGTTLLDSEVASINTGTQKLEAYVRIPSLSSSVDTVIYAYYGNPNATVSTSRINNVWSDYAGVWHMNEDPSSTADGICGGGSTHVCDSTANANNGTATGLTSGSVTTSPVGSGYVFDGASTSINMGSGASLDNLGPLSASFWLNPDANVPATVQFLLLKQDAACGTPGNWQLLYDNDGSVWAGPGGSQSITQTLIWTHNFDTSDPYTVLDNGAISEGPSNWQHVTLTWPGGDATVGTIYLNGSEVGSYNTQAASSGTDQDDSDCNLHVGSRYESNSYFDGNLDELRIRSTVLNPNWVATEYANQNSPATFYAVGSAEVERSASGSLTSAIFDLGKTTSTWGTLNLSADNSNGVTVYARTDTASDMSGATAWGSCSAVTPGADISANSCVTDGHQYLQYKIDLAPVSSIPPIVKSITVQSLNQNTATIAEEGGTIDLTAVIDQISGSNVTVPYTVSGTATNPSDHNLADGNITITAGSLSGTQTITIANDAVAESSETIIATLGSPTNGSAGNTSTYTITITDTDVPTTGSIGDFIWDDLDGDGVQDAGEVGIDGVTVDLYDDADSSGTITEGDSVLTTKTTAGGGAFDFTGLGAGDYIVDVTDTGAILTDISLTTANDPLAVTLASQQDYNTADFGYQGGGTIGGMVWSDANNDGLRGPSEFWITGVTIALHQDVNSNGIYDSPGDTLLSSATTGADGTYQFTSLAAGNYIVRVTDTEARLTNEVLTSSSSELAVTLAFLGNTNNVDFGYGSSAPSGGIDTPTSNAIFGGGTSVSVVSPSANSGANTSSNNTAPAGSGVSTEEGATVEPEPLPTHPHDDLNRTSFIPEVGLINPDQANEYKIKSLFSDVVVNHPFYEPAVHLFLNKVVTGDADGAMQLQRNINRVELLTATLRAYGAEITDAPGVWYQSYLNYATDNEIVNEAANQNFSPDNLASYGEVLRVIAKTFQLVPKDVSEPKGVDWPQPYHEALLIRKVLPVSYASNVNWYRPMSRGEVFNLLSRAMYLADAEGAYYLNQITVSLPDVDVYHVPASRTLISQKSVWLKDLQDGAGFYEEIRPGHKGKLVVFAHSLGLEINNATFNAAFEPVQNGTKVGDLVLIRRFGRTETYQITSRTLINEDQLGLISEGILKTDLILFTCDDNPNKRWMFEAKRVIQEEE